MYSMSWVYVESLLDQLNQPMLKFISQNFDVIMCTGFQIWQLILCKQSNFQKVQNVEFEY